MPNYDVNLKNSEDSLNLLSFQNNNNETNEKNTKRKIYSLLNYKIN